METRTAGVGQRTWPGHHRLPSAARPKKMEPDRASSLLIHHTELAWQAPGQLPDDRAADRCDHHPHRPAGTVRHRRCSISGRCEGVRCRDGRPQAHAPRIPWRVELHYRTKVATLIAAVIVQQALIACGIDSAPLTGNTSCAPDWFPYL